MPDDLKAYEYIIAATILLIVAVTLVGGCSGPQVTPGSVLNNSANATIRPGQANVSANSSANENAVANWTNYSMYMDACSGEVLRLDRCR